MINIETIINQFCPQVNIPFKDTHGGAIRSSGSGNTERPRNQSVPAVYGRVRDIWYFHKDHLDSSTLITHGTGSISQQVLYLTYGEVFLEKQRNTNDNLSPYRFNCKELNEEIMYIFIVIPCHHYFVNKEATIDSTVDNDGYVTKDGIIGGVKDKSNDLYITIDENIVL